MSVFDRTDHLKDAGHEQVVFCQDRASGLRAIIAIYSTALGPALGGTRFYPYASEDAAVEDVLKLSRAMAYKAACAGIDLGGGKAVILGDPSRDKTEALLRAYGRYVESLGGRYYTACDVGTYVQDMDVIAKDTRFATGCSPEQGGAGDSAVLTAYGVFQAMRAAAQHTWGSPSLEGRRVAVEGVGKVGRTSSSTCSPTAPRSWPPTSARPRWSGCAPSARSRRPTSPTSRRARATCTPLRAGRVGHRRAGARTAGGGRLRRGQQPAGPPRAREGAGRPGRAVRPGLRRERRRLVQVADEAQHLTSGGFRFDRAKAKAAGIFDTTLRVFELADSEGVPPAVAADRLAERRMAEVGRLRSVLVPGRTDRATVRRVASAVSLYRWGLARTPRTALGCAGQRSYHPGP